MWVCTYVSIQKHPSKYKHHIINQAIRVRKLGWFMLWIFQSTFIQHVPLLNLMSPHLTVVRIRVVLSVLSTSTRTKLCIELIQAFHDQEPLAPKVSRAITTTAWLTLERTRIQIPVHAITIDALCNLSYTLKRFGRCVQWGHQDKWWHVLVYVHLIVHDVGNFRVVFRVQVCGR